MQIRQIVNTVLDDFPDLKKREFTNVDINRVWESYYEDMLDALLDPRNLYLRYLNIGDFKLAQKPLFKYIEKKISIPTNWPDLDPNKQILELSKLLDILNKMVHRYNTLIDYLEGDDSHIRCTVSREITLPDRKERCLEHIRNIKEKIKEYDQEIITRNLEKQKTNS